MVAPVSLGKFKPSKLSPAHYWTTFVVFILFGTFGGYWAGLQPAGEWRFFSWHPLLMSLGMITLPGIATITKKLKGKMNTKIHGIVAWAGIVTSLMGLYMIYLNKEKSGFQHLKSNHAWIGLFVMVNYISIGFVGGIVLHPDFGMDNSNKTIRFVHLMAGRFTIIIAWLNTFLGLYQMNVSQSMLIMYGVPLVLLVPFSLI